MTNKLDCNPWFCTPTWLDELNNQDVFPLRLLLRNSLYYPASACDGDPIRLLGGFIHSFIHVDYAIKKAEVMSKMRGASNGFKGYRLAMCREVLQSELMPDGWQPSHLLPDDGNPMAFEKLMPTPFALWGIFDRLPGFDDVHGPARFSLLHICGDGAATFEALYNEQRIQPDVLTIIQPGTGYGLNWTDFRNPDQILARLAFANKGGKPRYLLQEKDRNARGYWPGYDQCLEEWSSYKGRLALYKCNNPHPEDDGMETIFSNPPNGDYCGFAGIGRRLYETFMRNRDAANSS